VRPYLTTVEVSQKALIESKVPESYLCDMCATLELPFVKTPVHGVIHPNSNQTHPSV
jgi:hypothetical protein